MQRIFCDLCFLIFVTVQWNDLQFIFFLQVRKLRLSKVTNGYVCPRSHSDGVSEQGLEPDLSKPWTTLVITDTLPPLKHPSYLFLPFHSHCYQPWFHSPSLFYYGKNLLTFLPTSCLSSFQPVFFFFFNLLKKENCL